MEEERQKKKTERKKEKAKGKKKGNAMDPDEIDPELALLVSGSTKIKESKETNDDNGEVDPRFATVITNPKDFGFDSTNPLYKGSSAFVKKVHKKRAAMLAAPKKTNTEQTQSNQVDVKSIVDKV